MAVLVRLVHNLAAAQRVLWAVSAAQLLSVAVQRLAQGLAEEQLLEVLAQVAAAAAADQQLANEN